MASPTLKQPSPDERSRFEQFLALPYETRLERLKLISDDMKKALLFDWKWKGRPKQQPPEEAWLVWLILAGRGWGKTATGAHQVRRWVEKERRGRIALIGPTSGDCRDVMLEGESGLLNICPPWAQPVFEPSRRRLVWPNGAIATFYSAEEPERLRGPQHDAGWCFVAGTQITLADGSTKPIEAMQPGDMALTRSGPRRVTVACSTGIKPVATITHAQGALTGTLDHPIWVDGRGWQPLGTLQPGYSIMLLGNSQGVLSWIGSRWMDFCGIAKRQPGTIATTWVSRCISGSLRSITVQCQQVTWFITRTMTKQIMTLATWSQCRVVSTQDFTPTCRDLGSSAWGLSGALNTARSSGQRKNRVFGFAFGAVKHLSRALQKLFSAMTHVGALRSVRTSSEALTGTTSAQINLPSAEVFNLSVEGAHEYFANGVLVHNCDELAAWTYLQETWDMYQFGLRLGKNPPTVITTTPKPLPLIRELVKKAADPNSKVFISSGSTYENKANLAETFFNQIAQYEGTKLGRQEIHAEVLDLEEGGIIKRSWLRLWPNDVKFPEFEFILQSYDTAFTEKTTNDPTACTVWGIFRKPDGPYCAMLLDSWDEFLEYPDLRKKVKDDFREAIYGEPGHKTDMVLIEDKGSGITLRQDLERTGVPCAAYNPGKQDKVARLHIVSYLAKAGRIYIPESVNKKGQFRTWARNFVEQLCVFPNDPDGHDDYVDSFSQALSFFRDDGWLVVDAKQPPERFADDDRKKGNPYFE